MTATRWLIAAALGGGVGWLAYRRQALTADGALAAACVGGVVFARGGVPAAATLLAFFGTSTGLSRLGERRKQSLPLAQAKGARRDASQVLANGGVATLSIALGQREAFLGALAAAAADTWATELGMLANGPPRLITSFRKVPAGTSGGVTPEGFAASLGGALVVGLTYGLLEGDRRAALVASVSGVCASLADSLLGATLQAAYWCPACDLPTEEPVHQPCETPTELKHGYNWITNDTVNALATAVGAGIAVLLRTPDAAGHVRGGG